MRSMLLAALVLACGSASKVSNPPKSQMHAAPTTARSSRPLAAPCSPPFLHYEPTPASSIEVRLPAIPKFSRQPIRVGSAYSVWGASYYLRNRVHRAEVKGKRITIEGYIVKTNLSEAPRCAVHSAGRADAAGCRPPIPAFWIGDTRSADPDTSIKVMGWASNYAQIYDAIREFDSGKEGASYADQFWGVRLPNPLPAFGAKVRVTGVFSTTFTKASSGDEADPVMGLLDLQEIVYLEPAAELASLPGVARRARR